MGEYRKSGSNCVVSEGSTFASIILTFHHIDSDMKVKRLSTYSLTLIFVSTNSSHKRGAWFG